MVHVAESLPLSVYMRHPKSKQLLAGFTSPQAIKTGIGLRKFMTTKHRLVVFRPKRPWSNASQNRLLVAGEIGWSKGAMGHVRERAGTLRLRHWQFLLQILNLATNCLEHLQRGAKHSVWCEDFLNTHRLGTRDGV